MPTSEYTQYEYERDFKSKKRIQENALDRALDTRKFEIELYWKRAAYFWTFIGAVFAGFIAVQAANIDLKTKTDLSVILACLGSVFSFAWILVNRGSKYWQENWEKHVDMLEDEISGPLYKVILTRYGSDVDFTENLLTGTSPFSVSKINQLISCYILFIWFFLVLYALPPFDFSADINYLYSSIILGSIISCFLIFKYSGSYQGGYWIKATIRTTTIPVGKVSEP